MNRIYLGVDIGGTVIKYGMVSSEGRILKSWKKEKNIKDLPNIVKNITNEYKIEGIGVGIAGLVNREGEIQDSPNIKELKGRSIKDFLPQTNIPITTGNDATVFTTGEWMFGIGKGFKNVVGLTLGAGIGGGIVAENSVIEGADNYAGEVGHTIINPEGPQCRCGRKGCLESFIGGYYLTERAKLLYKKRGKEYKNLTPEILYKKAKNNDQIAIRIFDEFSFYLSIGLSNIISIFDPDIIVLGGGLTYGSEIFFNRTMDYLKKITFGKRKTKVKITPVRDLAGLRGAVAYFLYKSKR